MGAKTARHKNINSGEVFVNTCRGILGGLISIGLLLWVTLFPLILHDSYFDVLETKYRCIYTIIIGMLAAVAIFSLIFLFLDAIQFHLQHAKAFFKKLAPVNWKNIFCLPDVMIIGFWLVCVISTLQSDYIYESFWGNEGRCSGLFLISLYVIAYFLITRLWKPKRWVVELFILSGLIICILGIGDFFYLDPLGLKTGVNARQKELFTSTLGNINSYTAYVGIVMGLTAGLFATEKNPLRAAWYYIATAVAMFAIVTGYSENAYLSLGALLGLMPLLFFQNEDGVWRYPLMLATFFTIVKGVDVIIDALPGETLGTESAVFDTIANFPLLIPIIAVLLAISLFLAVRRYRGKMLGNKKKAITIGWGVMLILALAALIFALYDVNVLGNVERYPEAFRNYLEFNDAWGTQRGYIWRKTVELFGDFPLVRKLVGYGPDTFGILTVTNIYQDMGTTTGQVYDNAHNEYLQYLTTIGIAGLGFYLAFVGTAIKKMISILKENPWVMGLIAAVTCYCVQAIVNFIVPIVDPAYWLMLFLGITWYRNSEAYKLCGQKRAERQEKKMKEKAAA